MSINFIKLNKDAKVPEYATENSAGCDLRACIKNDIELKPRDIVMVPTGLACAIPDGYCGFVCSRSGLAYKNGIAVLNSPGIVDSDYRGELKIILINHSQATFVITNGMRIAQMLIIPIKCCEWRQCDNLSETKRSVNGFGSTGVL